MMTKISSITLDNNGQLISNYEGVAIYILRTRLLAIDKRKTLLITVNLNFISTSFYQTSINYCLKFEDMFTMSLHINVQGVANNGSSGIILKM